MAQWRFYGRDEELATLQSRLQLRPEERRPYKFAAYYVMGRRGVGKTGLLDEAVRRSGTRLPVVTFEFEGGDNSAECLRKLVDRVNEQGHGALLDDLAPRRPTQTENSRFTDVMAHLIGKGAVVSLDEFHHADKHEFVGGLVGGLKIMIDGFQGVVNGTHPPGKLLLMGSHQQRMANLFLSDQPLHQRVELALWLRQWPVGTVLEMAAEQGLLARPGRFLTLWTAYGGVPRYWERFAANRQGQMDGFRGTADEDAWRKDFIRTERHGLSDHGERFDARAYASVERTLRPVLLTIARSPKLGMTAEQIVERLSDRARLPDGTEKRIAEDLREQAAASMPTVRSIDDDMEMLCDRMELVDCSGDHLDILAPVRWRIQDLNSLFQLQVFPELFVGKGRKGSDGFGEPSADTQLQRLKDLEGRTFERFCAEWLRERPDVQPVRARHGAKRGRLPDVDVLAEMGRGRGARLLLGGCKRDGRGHRPNVLRKQFAAFMESLQDAGPHDRKAARQELSMPRVHAAFSPAFDEPQVGRLEAEGFECHDIRSMARTLGIDPGMSEEGRE